MPEIHRNPEISDTEKTEVSAFKEIKPETDMTVSDAKSFVDSLFKETQDTSDGYYNSYETRSSNIPVDGVRGKWEGERGERFFMPPAFNRLSSSIFRLSKSINCASGNTLSRIAPC